MRADPALRKAVLSGVEGEDDAMAVDEDKPDSDIELVAPTVQVQKVCPPVSIAVSVTMLTTTLQVKARPKGTASAASKKPEAQPEAREDKAESTSVAKAPTRTYRKKVSVRLHPN